MNAFEPRPSKDWVFYLLLSLMLGVLAAGAEQLVLKGRLREAILGYGQVCGQSSAFGGRDSAGRAEALIPAPSGARSPESLTGGSAVDAHLAVARGGR
jgi:hypothetical protein